MAVEYANRQGKIYYLHIGTTKKGNPRYYLSPAHDGTLADELPDGFEIHEMISGQVVLRRERPRLITDEELRIVESELSRIKEARWSYVERDGEIITVYVARQSELLEESTWRFAWISQAKLEEVAPRFSRYQAVFRFVLTDSAKRLFQGQRFCYLGSVDDWIFIGQEAPLQLLAHQYLLHINQDSYYELM